MWEHAAVQENVAVLRRRGVMVMDPESGRLAGGDSGTGRLASAKTIIAAAESVLSRGRDLAGARVLVTAGCAREPIDAVRVIANRSSGRQGHAIADEAVTRGADVTLVTTSELPSSPGVRVVRVETAAEMQCAVEHHAPSSDVIVMTAAVADFRPVAVSEGKWKKENGAPRTELEPTPDILAGLGAAKRPGQVLVGLAAETDNVEERARGKMARKNLDVVVSNDVSASGVGFGHDTNEVVIHLSTGTCTRVPLSDRRRVAAHVLDSVAETRRRN